MVNKLNLNVFKCLKMSYHRTKNKIILNYNIDSFPLTEVEYVLDLGIWFKSHVSQAY